MNFVDHLNFNQLTLYLMAICLIIGAIDYQRGNCWGLGKRFEEGFNAFFPLFIMMGGILTFVPAIEKFFAPAATQFFSCLGLDPGLFPGLILANDTGGYFLAHALAKDPAVGDLGGMLIGAMVGTNLIFNLPVALNMIPKSNRDDLAQGFLFGFIALPLGGFVGGLALGMPFGTLSIQMIPVTMVSLILALAIWLIPNSLTRIFVTLGKIVAAAALIGIIAAVTAELTGIHTAPFLDSVDNSIKIIGSIVIVLPGSYVFITLVSRCFHKPFSAIGKIVGINDISVIGILSSVSNTILTFGLVKDMDRKGKVLNFAFLTAGSFALGDHLAFCAVVAPNLIFPMLAAKFSAAAFAVFLAIVFFHIRGSGTDKEMLASHNRGSF